MVSFPSSQPTPRVTADNLHAGDEVYLRSGGPPMTVVDVGRDTGFVFCQWQGADGGITSYAFSATVLQHNRPHSVQASPAIALRSS